MKQIKHTASKLMSFFVCVLLVFSAMPQVAAVTATKVVFAATDTPNRLLTPYSELVGEYLAERLGNAETVTAPVVDIDNDDFLTVLKDKVLAEEPDIVFWEIDISKSRRGGDDAAREKAAAVIETLLSAKKVPAVYLVYVPEATFLDNRAPFESVAKYYDLKELDVYTPLKAKYASGELETKDFLTAGIIPGEGGHRLIADFIINGLKGVADLTKLPNTGKAALANPAKFEQEATGEEPKSEIATDGTIFYVATNGRDDGEGSIEKPFRTLERAKEAVREVRKKQGDAFAGATVYIREGLYSLKGGLTLNEEDGGTETARVIYSAYPDETVRITNGGILTADRFKPVTEAKMLARIPEASRDKVLVCDLTAAGFQTGYYKPAERDQVAGGTCREYNLGSMFSIDGRSAERSRWPNSGFASVSDKQPGSARNIITYDGDRPERWLTATDEVRVKGQLGQGYNGEWMKIKSIDTENKVITLGTNANYGVAAGFPWCVIDLIEEMDMPGEWFLDESTNLLYYYPRGDINKTELLYSSDQSDMITLNKTTNVTIQNIEFTTGCGTAVTVLDGISNLVDGCEIHNMGGSGVKIKCNDIVGPRDNGVTNCHIHETAIDGVTFEGGDRYDLTPQNDYVRGCHIENFSTECVNVGCGVYTEGTVSVKIENNTIHNDNSPAINIGGNDDYVAYNEFCNVVKECDDYGAIYGDHRGLQRQGVVVKNNYFHDIVLSALGGTTGQINGFYSDAMRNNGATVNDNVFVNVQGGIFFAQNHNQCADGNLFLDSIQYSINAYEGVYGAAQRADYYTRIREALADGTFWNPKSEAESIEKLLWRGYMSSPEFTEEAKDNPYYLKYPWLEHYLDSDFLEARDIIVRNNAIFKCDGYIKMPKSVRDYIHTDDNYTTSEAIPETESGSDCERVDIAMEIASEKLPEFRAWDVREAGIFESDIPVGDFELIYPLNGETEIDPEFATLHWDYASGADNYHVLVATDPEFKNVVYDEVKTGDWAHVSGLEAGAKRYYWKVTASAQSEKFIGTPENTNGVFSFVTCKKENVDKTELNDNIAYTKAKLENMTEGTEGGQYAVGSIEKLTKLVEEAEALSENFRCTRKAVIDTANELYNTTQEVLSTVQLSEIDFSDVFKADSVQYVAQGGTKDGSDQVAQSGDGVSLTGSGSLYTTEKLAPHEIAHFKAKFDFSGISSGSVYTIFGMRVQEAKGYMYATSDYVFLVTKDNIELQAFKQPSGIGGMYMTIPNNYIKEGQEHDIEFGAIPANNGKAVRIILAVDGQVIYDVLDEKNIITEGGFAGVSNSSASCCVTILPADEKPDYPLLVDRLNDPESELYMGR